MKSAFPRTVDAARKRERSLWSLGDSFVADLKAQGWKPGEDIQAKLLTRCREEISADQGSEEHDYTSDFLRRVAHTAIAFKPSERQDYSLTLCRAASTPDNLANVVRELKKLRKPLTTVNVTWLMSEWRENAAEERHRVHEDAKQKRSRATTAQEREDADREVERTRPAPRGRQEVPPEHMPETSVLERRAAILDLDLKIKDVSKQLRDMLEVIQEYRDSFEEKTITRLTESTTRMVQDANQVLEAVSGKRTRFKTITGGAA